MRTYDRWIARRIGQPLIRLYRLVLSPALWALGSRCRFTPSCSRYAEEALHEHGFARGVLLSTMRLAKCNPLHPGGYDPVPPGPDGENAYKRKTNKKIDVRLTTPVR
ncbi:membrane protein insertion efficiency factor YidD [bacterium]|nr:membrane protein insertion efficiency factor YidD [bacterium]